MLPIEKLYFNDGVRCTRVTSFSIGYETTEADRTIKSIGRKYILRLANSEILIFWIEEEILKLTSQSTLPKPTTLYLEI